jgi:hypothetical protein
MHKCHYASLMVRAPTRAAVVSTTKTLPVAHGEAAFELEAVATILPSRCEHAGTREFVGSTPPCHESLGVTLVPLVST